MKFSDIFSSSKPLIGVIHLLALPGSPLYDGNLDAVYEKALEEADIYKRNGIDGIIIENFRDKPFFPDRVPAETIAALAAITRDIVKTAQLPVGVNVLRSDGESAMAIATAAQAQFIRVNVHMSAIVSEQGIMQGTSHKTMRLRSYLKSDVLVFADVGVKHAAPLADRGLAIETKDLTGRGMADAIIVSGELTGSETKTEDVDIVRANTQLPILIGSGTTAENMEKVFQKVNGFIVGTYFKKEGKSDNFVEEARVKQLAEKVKYAWKKV